MKRHVDGYAARALRKSKTNDDDTTRGDKTSWHSGQSKKTRTLITSSDSRHSLGTDSDSGDSRLERCRHVSNLPAEVSSESETTTSAWNDESRSSSSKENIVESTEKQQIGEGVSLEENGIPEAPSPAFYLRKVCR